jgi:hypothetical protein
VDSNHRLTDYESAALTAELPARDVAAYVAGGKLARMLHVPAAYIAAAAVTVLTGASGSGGSWELQIARHGGGAFCMQVTTTTPDGLARNQKVSCVQPALRFFGHVTVTGNGITTRDGTPVVAAEAGVVTARARRVVITYSHGARLRLPTRRAPKGFRTTGGERVRLFGGDALSIPRTAKIKRIAGYSASGRRVALNRAPIASPDRTH